jgi:Tfp pilus assembly protein PilF
MRRLGPRRNARAASALLLLSAPVFNRVLPAQDALPAALRTNSTAWASFADRDGLDQAATEVTRARLTVSAEELRHPLSRKGRKLIEKAQDYARAGDDSHAIEELDVALKEPTAVPYAHSVLGAEYLKLHQIRKAIAEFEAAVHLLPRSPIDHSNLGFVLCVGGQTVRGAGEIEKALSLDQGLLKARFLKGVMLLDRGSPYRAAWEDLEAAQREIPIAHLALALLYARHGESFAAQQQLRGYVGLMRGPTLAEAQRWLSLSSVGIPAAEALGLWLEPRNRAESP